MARAGQRDAAQTGATRGLPGCSAGVNTFKERKKSLIFPPAIGERSTLFISKWLIFRFVTTKLVSWHGDCSWVMMQGL